MNPVSQFLHHRMEKKYGPRQRPPLRIVVLVSGNGSNLQALIDAEKDGRLVGGEIKGVLSSSEDAYALKRAKEAGILTSVVSKAKYPSDKQRTARLLELLNKVHADVIVLAGYMYILPAKLIKNYKGQIVNIHPALIPKHCGKGYYGHHVHEAVLAAGDEESGATVHYVDEGVDTGEIIVQRRVPVLPGDDAAALAARVLEVEHEIIVEGVNTVLEKINDENHLHDIVNKGLI